jgi:hypothetical protein
MSSQINEEVVDNFRIGEDDFRNIDSIVRQRCHSVKYFVYKGSATGGYDTDDVEKLLKDTNSIQTRIQSVRIHATGADALKFNIDFDKWW